MIISIQSFLKNNMVRSMRFELTHPKILPPQGSASAIPPRPLIIEAFISFNNLITYFTTASSLSSSIKSTMSSMISSSSSLTLLIILIIKNTTTAITKKSSEFWMNLP